MDELAAPSPLLHGTEPTADAVFVPSFVEFYEQRYAAMVRLAVALTGSAASGEDLVQDSFVRVHARWDRISDPSAYLRRTVVNACRSAQRRSRRERALVVLERAPSTALEANELFDVLARLPYRQRAALVLRYYEGLSQREIGQVLGCSEGTVASLVHRAIAQLRRLMSS